jgi:peroxiredoxin
MAQLRRDYAEFVRRDAEVMVTGPENADAFAAYWTRMSKELPFVGVPDPDHVVADLYGQETSLLRLGRLPALVLIDKAGQMRYQHYGRLMSDIPPNQEILASLDELNAAEAFPALPEVKAGGS